MDEGEGAQRDWMKFLTHMKEGNYTFFDSKLAAGSRKTLTNNRKSNKIRYNI